ncbi:MAG: hypothetical protein M1475_06565 [Actinobacteria bacterium]|nr:hypothetical protein [Actinomycetota bacterium]
MNKQIKNLIMVSAAVLSFILILSLFSCSILNNIVKLSKGTVADKGTSDKSTSSTKISNDSVSSAAANENAGENNSGSNEENSDGSGDNKDNDGNSDSPVLNNYRLVYFEVTSDEKSNHFEHRVANIYSIKIDGDDKRLIYSDINDKYDLGPILSISPDGKKIACMVNEGGRGAYSALCVLDIESGDLKKLVEFDYTQEPVNILLMLYGIPIWSPDSRYLAYELISNPYTSNFRDRGVFLADTQTGKIKEVVLDVGGASLRSTMFMVPVFFFEDSSKIAAAFHPYYTVEKDSEVTGYYSLNEGLNCFGVEGGAVTHLFETSIFKGKDLEIISSFDKFSYIEDLNKMVFQVLGDFEEDGDVWISSIDGSDAEKLTNDIQLREQQPDVYVGNGENPMIAYAGVKRYGTVSNQIPSGDIYIINADGTNNKKLTNYNIGPSKPVFSPDGTHIAYINSIYDENFENIIKNQIETVDITGGQISVPVKNGFIELVGWTINN